MRWSDFVIGLLAAALGGGISALLTVWARTHALRIGMLDQPGERRSHVLPTPRGGGIGIAAVGLLVFPVLAWSTHSLVWLLGGVGLLLVSAVGWWDDHRPLSALLRLLAHAAAGVLLAFALWWAYGDARLAALAFLLVPVFVNVWNFMDGINGLAASQALLCALAMAVAMGGGAEGVIAVTIAAACLGFLPFNFPKARIFLGDVGSGALGYLMALLLLLACQRTPVPYWAVLILPFTAFLFDSGFTLLRRMVRGERWWEAHTQHVYQRLAVKWGHAAVTLTYALGTLAGIAVLLWLKGLFIGAGR